MKPGKGDIPVKIRISGRPLQELQRHAWQMCEAFGLDRKIEKYKGTRPISLYSWDLDCIFAVLDVALNDKKTYPDPQDEGFVNLLALEAQLKQAYKETYASRTLPSIRRYTTPDRGV